MILLTILLLHCAMMSLAWLVRFNSGQSGWIDAIWSLSVALLGCVAAWAPFQLATLSTRQVIVGVGVLVAFSRLGLDIARRARRSADDPRYLALQEKWGVHYRSRLFWFLQIQAACGFILSLTIYLAARNPAPFGRPFDWVGLALMLIAVAGEAAADRQLRIFKQTHTSELVCDIGLWSLSRHPNYFFQWLFWIGVAMLGINVEGEWSWGFLALSGPLMMYWLLVYVSGIPPLEKHMMQSRPEAFAAYQKRVNAFFPFKKLTFSSLLQKK